MLDVCQRGHTRNVPLSAINGFACMDDLLRREFSGPGAIHNSIMDAFSRGKWQSEWALVHGVYLAAGTTIIISSESGGSIEFEGTAKPGGSLDLADASANIEGKISDKIQFEILAKAGLTPLICLSKIRPGNRLLALLGWSEKTIRPMVVATDSGSEAAPGDNDVNKMTPEVTTELTNELNMPPGELFHMVELDGNLP